MSDFVKARINELPKRAQDKIKSIKRQDRDAETASEARWNQQQRLLANLNEAKARLNALERDSENGRLSQGKTFTTKHGVETVIEPSVELAEARAEVEERKAELAEFQAKKLVSSGVTFEKVAQRIARQPAGEKWQSKIPEIKPRKGETAQQYLDGIREQIAKENAAIRGAENAWLPESEAFAAAKVQIDRIAASGAPYFRGLYRVTNPHVGRGRQGEVKWPENFVGSDLRPDGFALTVWLNRDALLERAKKEIATLARPDNSLTIAERHLKIADIESRILELERLEEAALMLIGDANPIRRPDADIRAVLQIEPFAEAATEDDDDFG